MRIYFAQAKDFDFKNEYYKPIKNNLYLRNETLIFPHEEDLNNKHTRGFYRELDLFIAEVSYRATGLGIELGFASDDKIPIYCFYKKGTKPNSTLKCITNHLIEYTCGEELAQKIEKIVKNLKEKE